MALYQAVDRYRNFLRQPDVQGILWMSFFARMPIGMMSLAMLMYLGHVVGSLAFAGAHVGIYMVSMSITAPIIGRFIDRYGARLPLIVAGIVHPLALWSILLPAWFPSWHLPAALITIAIASAGAFCPPIVVLTRAVWRYRFETADLRQTAFSFDAVLTELNFVIGPMLVALVLIFASPVSVFALAAFCATLTVPLFMLSSACRYVKHDPTVKRHWLGPLTEPKLLWVFTISFMAVMALGALELGYPTFAIGYGKAFWGGILIAASGVGSAMGGMIYGGWRLKMSDENRLVIFLSVLLLFTALHMLATVPGWLLLCAFLAGMLVAPSLTVLTMMITRYAQERYTAEAFTWSSTCIVSGIGAGMALGGALGERFGVIAIFALATSSCAIALVLSYQLKRKIARDKCDKPRSDIE
jgi:MFS family permease